MLGGEVGEGEPSAKRDRNKHSNAFRANEFYPVVNAAGVCCTDATANSN